MTGKSFEACAQKMRDSEMSEVAVEQFKRLYECGKTTSTNGSVSQR